MNLDLPRLRLPLTLANCRPVNVYEAGTTDWKDGRAARPVSGIATLLPLNGRRGPPVSNSASRRRLGFELTRTEAQSLFFGTLAKSRTATCLRNHPGFFWLRTWNTFSACAFSAV